MNKQVQHYLFQSSLETERKAERKGYQDLAESCRYTQIDLIRERVIQE